MIDFLAEQERDTIVNGEQKYCKCKEKKNPVQKNVCDAWVKAVTIDLHNESDGWDREEIVRKWRKKNSKAPLLVWHKKESGYHMITWCFLWFDEKKSLEAKKKCN